MRGCDVTERLSHSVLLNMESEAKPWSDVAMLIAEVRRLRGLIAYWGEDDSRTVVLREEARAIRAELDEQA